MIPTRTPFFLPWLYRGLVWRKSTDEKALYLTFDDGPVPGPTEFVLDTLRSLHAKATFFCIGDNVRKYPRVFEQVVKDGHTIGNHTFHHLNGWKTPAPAYLDNVRMCDQQMQKNDFFSDDVRLFRPPYGRITRHQISMLSNYRIIMWDVLTHDYRSRLHPERCLSSSICATRNGSIIVFHDSYKAEKNMRFVLPRFMNHFLDRGFQFKALVP